MPGVIQNTENLRASRQVAFLRLSGGTTGIQADSPHPRCLPGLRYAGSVDNIYQ